MVELAAIRDGWDQAARENATYNILTEPNYTNGWPPDAFFKTGRDEIALMLDRLDGLGLRRPRKQRALDFGCGIGRLTQALASEYARVIGVDISQEMVSLADTHNQHGQRCTYKNITSDDLNDFKSGSFDLIYSNLVLQHMPQELQHGYVREFVRLIRRDGLAVFQMQDGFDFAHPTSPWLSMYGVPLDTVTEWIAAAGGRVRDVELNRDWPPWVGCRYTVSR